MNTSPVQKLFSRRIKTFLPTTSDLLTHKVEKGENVSKLLNNKLKKTKYYYDRCFRLLRDLRIDEIVRVQPLNSKHLWKLGMVVLQYTPRLYVVEVDGKLLTHNRNFLKTTPKFPIVLPGFDNFNFDDSSHFQDRNVNNEPTAASNPPIQSQTKEFAYVKRGRTRVIRPSARYQDYEMN